MCIQATFVDAVTYLRVNSIELSVANLVMHRTGAIRERFLPSHSPKIHQMEQIGRRFQKDKRKFVVTLCVINPLDLLPQVATRSIFPWPSWLLYMLFQGTKHHKRLQFASLMCFVLLKYYMLMANKRGKQTNNVHNLKLFSRWKH